MRLRRITAVTATLAVFVSSHPAQVQFDEVSKRHLPLDGDLSWAVALGDVDGDGDCDLVCGNHRQFRKQNRLYLNDGTGAFIDATAGRMPVDSDLSWAVAMEDVDGDGDRDLVFGNGSQTRLYLNGGTGTFADVTAARMPTETENTTAVALGDVDGDGDADLVLGSHGGQDLLYLNDGSGTFRDVTAARMPTDNDLTTAVALGDADGDGDADLVIGSLGTQNRLYLNDGTGTFTDATAARMPVDSDSTQAVALGDADGDADVDLVFANSGQNRLYLNDGTGTFTDATAARMPADSDTTSAVALTDVDSDGRPDLILGNGGQNRLYLNDGTGTFTDATVALLPTDNDFTNAVALGEADGDGDPDIFFGNGWQNRLYLNDGAGAFADATETRVPPRNDDTHAVELGDVDGDGDADLIVANGETFYAGEQNRLYLNDGSGTFADATANLPTYIDSSEAVALGDVDGDGDPDLVFGNGATYIQQQNRLYLNDGTGTFTDATAARMPTDGDRTRSVALGDVDGDGDPDLIFGNTGSSRLYLNDGTGTFTDATAERMPTNRSSAFALALADVDDDGDPDLVFGNWGQNWLYLNDGSGTFTDWTAALMPIDNDRTMAVALGDVDGDSDIDIVVGNRPESPVSSGQNRLYLNDGSGRFNDATSARMPTDSDASAAVALGDVDGDGDPDLVIGNGSSLEPNRLYVNDGAGTFTDATARLPVDLHSSAAVALRDVDGDGDSDIVFGGQLQNRLYSNLLRQQIVPFLPIAGRDYRLEVHARYGPPRLVDVAVPFVSTRTARIPLPAFGTFGLDPVATAPLPPFIIQHPLGLGSVAVPIPSSSSVVGVPIHAQSLLIQWPGRALLTNVTTDRIAR